MRGKEILVFSPIAITYRAGDDTTLQFGKEIAQADSTPGGYATGSALCAEFKDRVNYEHLAGERPVCHHHHSAPRRGGQPHLGRAER